MSWIEHHKISESLASQAQAALDEGRRQDALTLFVRLELGKDSLLRPPSFVEENDLAWIGLVVGHDDLELVSIFAPRAPKIGPSRI